MAHKWRGRITLGRLRKERKREAKKKEFNRKQSSQSRPQQGGRSVSSDRRKQQLVNKASNLNLDQLVELSRGGVGRDVIAAGIQKGITDRARRSGLSQRQSTALAQNVQNTRSQLARIQSQSPTSPETQQARINK